MMHLPTSARRRTMRLQMRADHMVPVLHLARVFLSTLSDRPSQASTFSVDGTQHAKPHESGAPGKRCW